MTLAGVSESAAATRAFSNGDDIASLWTSWSNGGLAPATDGPSAYGAAEISLVLAPQETAAITLVFSWYLPDRDYLNEIVGAFYSNLFTDSAAVASAVATPTAQQNIVSDLNAHHSVYALSSEPRWLADIAINSFSHMRNAFHMSDGRWRQWEALDCDDMDSVHNDYQRHLPYLFSFPVVEVQKSAFWGANAAADGHINEMMSVGCLGPPGPLDKVGGRLMSDVTTVWTMGLLELVRSGALGDNATALTFVRSMWPQVQRALEWQVAQTKSADAPGLPAHLVSTYDIIELEKYPTTTYNAFLHLAMMKAVGALADFVDDAATRAAADAAFVVGLAATRAQLWNSTARAFRAFSEVDPKTMPIFADSLYAVTIANDLGLGFLWDGPLDDFTQHLAAEEAFNGEDFGLRVLTGRDDPEPFEGIDKSLWGMATPTWSVMALLTGMDVDSALEPARRFFSDNILQHLRDEWNLAGLYTGAGMNGTDFYSETGAPWCTSHYGMPLTHYYLHHALSGQQTNIPAGTLSFTPRYACPFALPALLAGTTGTISCADSVFNLSIAFGRVKLPPGGLSVNGRVYEGAVDIGSGQSVAWT